MRDMKSIFRCRPLALALAAIIPPAFADDEVDQLIRPDSSFSVGAATVSADNQRFGMYRGLSDKGQHVIGDLSLVSRDDATGTWFRIEGRNLGLSTRELRVEHEKQGDWAYYLDYSQTPRVAPVTVHTMNSGIGTNSIGVPVTANTTTGAGVPRVSGGDTEIRTERDKTTLGFLKALFPGLDINIKFQNEEKRGTRLFGRGTVSGANIAQEFLAEPINSTTRQLDITLNYIKDALQLSGGYYGSFYNNHNTALYVNGGNNQFTSAAPPFSVMALPPDNQAHQLHFNGGYDLSKTTRATFKYAYTKNVQNDAFVELPPGGTNMSGRGSLDGRVDTTLMQFGLTSKPVKDLSLLANWRYENREDKSATAQYITAGASTDGFNERRSLKIESGKLEASYRLPAGFTAAGGVDYEHKERTMAGIRVVGYRVKTEETSYRAELRRALFDAVNGSLAVVQARRQGSNYWTSTNNRVQPVYIADRDRSKLRAAADWAPTDALSLQFAFEDSHDRYGPGRGSPDVGVRSGDSRLYSFDGSYQLSDRWQLTAFLSELSTGIDQATGTTSAARWTATMKDVGRTLGFGARGKVTGKVDVGADLIWAKDVSRYDLQGGGASPLPTIHNYMSTYKVFARYAYDKQTTLRLDYIHDRRQTDDWTWNGIGTPYIYTDGTWLYQDPNQKVHFLGVSMQYRFN